MSPALRSLALPAFLALFTGALVSPVRAGDETLSASIDAALKRSTPVPADQVIPVVDFLRPPRLRSLKLNPTGTHFAALLCPTVDRTDLLVQEIATKKMYRTGGGSSEGQVFDVTGFSWLGERELYYTVGKEKRYAWRTMAADFTRFERPRIISMHSVLQLLSLPRQERNHPLVWLMADAANRGEDGGVFKIDPAKCRAPDRNSTLYAEILEEYPAPVRERVARYLTDADGRLAYALTREKGHSVFWVFENGKTWRKSALDLERWNPLAPGDSANEIIAAPDNKPGEPSRLVRVDALTGEEKGVLYSDPNYSLTHASIRRRGSDHRITGIRYHANLPTTVWFDEEERRVHESLCAALPGQLVEVESTNLRNQVSIVSAYSDTTPLQYYLLNRETGDLQKLASSRPWIDPARMRPMQRLRYKTRDGLTLDAYVTLPAGASASSPVPLVVMPHGGPYVRDVFGWHSVVQFLASRGYAVMQPNYRGSLGYDWSMTKEDPAIFRKMHDDVTDGVQTLLKTGMVDRRRIAIMGGSFGGYLALCGVAFEPDLYRCAVTMAGVFDWERVMKESKRNDLTNDRYFMLKDNLGDPKKNEELFDAISPLRHIANVKVPVFVAHGEEDRTAYIDQSKKLVSELRKHGVPHQKLFEDDEGHGFRNLDARVKLQLAIEAFLEKHLK